jgi:hypothetical protein
MGDEARVPNVDRIALADALRHHLPHATVASAIINQQHKSWEINIRDDKHRVDVVWGPLSGFGATDLDHIRDDINPFASHDWAMETAEEAIDFVLRVFGIVL